MDCNAPAERSLARTGSATIVQVLHYIRIYVVLVVWLSLPCDAQQGYMNPKGYNCTAKPCHTYIFYRAQMDYYHISSIAGLFHVSQSEVAAINRVPGVDGSYRSFRNGDALFVPVLCDCHADNTSYANFTYTLADGDNLYDVATITFESLFGIYAFEKANPYNSSFFPGDDVSVPVACACPSTAQRMSNVSALVTYPVTKGDSLEQISYVFGVPSADILTANEFSTVNAELYEQTTILIPFKVGTTLPLLNTATGNSPTPSATSSTGDNSPAPAAGGNSPSSSTGAYIAVAVGAFAILVIAVALCCCLRHKLMKRRERKARRDDLEIESPVVATRNSMLEKLELSSSTFSFEDLRNATHDFSDLLGKGGFGSVYRGSLRIGGKETAVAVKRISATSAQGSREFLTEVKIIGQVQHRNLVRLLGWCCEDPELLLVYEYMSNRSVDKLLFQKTGQGNSELTWERRVNIVKGVATGLAYLHGEWEHRVIHRDVKCSNVMLDANFNPRLGDFGLARLSDHDQLPLSTVVAGTYGYLAPELGYGPTFKANEKTDIYAFGVMVLELTTGKRAIQEDELLVDLVWEHLAAGKLLEVVDCRIEHADGHRWEIARLLKLGLLCCHPDPQQRPQMRELLSIWKGSQPFPPVPLSKPIPVYPIDWQRHDRLENSGILSNHAVSLRIQQRLETSGTIELHPITL